jgi:sugar phosphate isomerase/epimerase
MKLSCQEGLAPGRTLKEKVENLERFGFEGIELWGSSNFHERVEEIIRATDMRRL